MGHVVGADEQLGRPRGDRPADVLRFANSMYGPGGATLAFGGRRTVTRDAGALDDRQLDRPLVAVDDVRDRRVARQHDALHLGRGVPELQLHRAAVLRLARADARRGGLRAARAQVGRRVDLERRVAPVVLGARLVVLARRRRPRRAASGSRDPAGRCCGRRAGDRRVAADQHPRVGQQHGGVVVGAQAVGRGVDAPLPVFGSKISACWTGVSRPGATTSSSRAPEVASTSPVGSSVPDEYQRRLLSGPVSWLVSVPLGLAGGRGAGVDGVDPAVGDGEVRARRDAEDAARGQEARAAVVARRVGAQREHHRERRAAEAGRGARDAVRRGAGDADVVPPLRGRVEGGRDVPQRLVVGLAGRVEDLAARRCSRRGRWAAGAAAGTAAAGGRTGPAPPSGPGPSTRRSSGRGPPSPARCRPCGWWSRSAAGSSGRRGAGTARRGLS